MKKLLLGSASPARKQTLINAGIHPQVMIADLDEEGLLEQFRRAHPSLARGELARTQVQLLATRKAETIYASLLDSHSPDSVQPNIGTQPSCDVIVGCDSMLEMNGIIVGKPHTSEIARERLRAMSGNAGYLHTGHCVIDTATGKLAQGVSTAVVYIAHLSDADIDAYIRTGEPLHVAGSFTVDGFGGPFVESIEGDYHGIVGISLPLLRSLLTELGHSITEFWASEICHDSSVATDLPKLTAVKTDCGAHNDESHCEPHVLVFSLTSLNYSKRSLSR